MKRAVADLSKELAERLQEESEELERTKDELAKERKTIDDEKAKMEALADHSKMAREIIKINVGGEIFATKRGTLLAASGTLLEAMFSGRWEDSLDRDDEGHVFIDYTPAVFRLLLSHLRVIRDAGPGQDSDPPVIPAEFVQEFRSMTTFFEVHDLILNTKEPVRPECLALRPAMSGAKQPCILQDGTVRWCHGGFHFPVVGCSTLLLAEGTAAFWKVSVRELPAKGWFYAGIVQCEDLHADSYSDSSSYGWGGDSQVYRGGAMNNGHGGATSLATGGGAVLGATRNNAGEWSGWNKGDEGIFKLDPEKRELHLRLIRANSAENYFSMPFGEFMRMRSFRVHLNLHAIGTDVAVTRASEADIQTFQTHASGTVPI